MISRLCTVLGALLALVLGVSVAWAAHYRSVAIEPNWAPSWVDCLDRSAAVPPAFREGEARASVLTATRGATQLAQEPPP